MAPASTRGSLATKKICASRLSANGIDDENTWRRSIGVDPVSGAAMHTRAAPAPKTIHVMAILRRIVIISRGGRARPEYVHRGSPPAWPLRLRGSPAPLAALAYFLAYFLAREGRR